MPEVVDVAYPQRQEQEINLLLRDAGQRDDRYGLMGVAGTNIVQNGGYTYLHRDVPILGLWNKPEQRCDRRGEVLHEAAGVPVPPGYEAAGDFVLHRRDGGCEARPRLDRRLLIRPF